MQHRILFLPERVTTFADTGMTVMQAIRQAGLWIDAPCGGNGTCGKCMVQIVQEDGSHALKLACQTYIHGDMTIRISSSVGGHAILHDGSQKDIELSPFLKRVSVKVDSASISDQRSVWQRLTDAVTAKLNLDADYFRANLCVANSLYSALLKHHNDVDVLVCNNEIIAVMQKGDACCAIAFDIGTTSIVGYLLDLETGKQLAVASMLNPQSAYGADVIMRSKHALDHGIQPLSNAVRDALNGLIRETAAKAEIDQSKIYMMSVVGNTCMHHLFLGISPESLVYAPYNTAISESLLLNTRDYGICINNAGKLMVFPNIAGFVGGDTVSAILASRLDQTDRLTLLIDIGTNGEIVLGNRNRMAACSTAAGPAFEGALIQCGMRGAEGAIDHFNMDYSQITYSVIGGGNPIGICGSGLIDVVAQLVKYGIIQESGKMLGPEDLPESFSGEITGRLREIGGMRCFFITSEVYITQKDIREVQLAKGAMAAGIKMLAAKLGVQVDAIEQVLIAGAFGNYMSPQSACLISLIPPVLEEKILPIGNAAGEGAKLAILNETEFVRARWIGSACKYLELAAQPEFQDLYVDELEFPAM